MKAYLGLLAASAAASVSASTLSAPEHKIGLQLVPDIDGKIESCAVAAPSDQPGSDKAICDAMVANGSVKLATPATSSKILTALRWTGDGRQLDRSYQPDDRDLILRPSSSQPWLAIQDYPDEILAGQSRRIEARYLVGPSGRIKECQTRDKRAEPALAEWTCKILMDRRVLPRALDGHGKPTSYSTASVFFWTPTAIRVCDAKDACFRNKN